MCMYICVGKGNEDKVVVERMGSEDLEAGLICGVTDGLSEGMKVNQGEELMIRRVFGLDWVNDCV